MVISVYQSSVDNYFLILCRRRKITRHCSFTQVQSTNYVGFFLNGVKPVDRLIRRFASVWRIVPRLWFIDKRWSTRNSFWSIFSVSGRAAWMDTKNGALRRFAVVYFIIRSVFRWCIYWLYTYENGSAMEPRKPQSISTFSLNLVLFCLLY